MKILAGAQFCVNCKWQIVRDAVHICLEPSQSRLDYVTGQRDGIRCRDMRGPAGPCGERGDLFVKRSSNWKAEGDVWM
jgi:hypothetical protein